MRRRFTRRNASGRPLRPMDWAAASFECGQTVGIPACSATAIWVLPPTVVREFFVDPTLMTSLISIGSVTTNAPGTSVGTLLFGLIAWDSIDDTLTAGDIPDPFNHGNLDWIGVGSLYHRTGGAAGFYSVTTSERGDGFVQYKSKRRLGNQTGIMLSLFNDSTASVNMGFQFRGLIKE